MQHSLTHSLVHSRRQAFYAPVQGPAVAVPEGFSDWDSVVLDLTGGAPGGGHVTLAAVVARLQAQTGVTVTAVRLGSKLYHPDTASKQEWEAPYVLTFLRRALLLSLPCVDATDHGIGIGIASTGCWSCTPARRVPAGSRCRVSKRRCWCCE